MSDKNQIKLSIHIESIDGKPVDVKSVIVNDQVFTLSSNETSKNIKVVDEQPRLEIPISTVALIPNEPDKPPIDSYVLDPEYQFRPSEQALKPNEEYNTLEEFGGNSFYRMFWGKLTYSQHDASQTKVTYEGNEDVFDISYVGKWLEPSRIHKCSTEFPERGRNYFPGGLAVVYSRVVEVLDGRNLIVDFAYNGGGAKEPKSIREQDGIFFFDNKFAITSWSQAEKRKDVLKANAGQTYACMGMPKIIAKENSVLNFHSEGGTTRPAIHLMMSDAYNGDKFGRGIDVPESFSETFGENLVFIELPSKGKVSVDFDWQFIPPTYTQKVVQYGVPDCYFFRDGSGDSKQFGLKRVSNYDQFRNQELMKAALGFIRPGASFSMPNQGYCNGGGIHDGRDIVEFCTYRFEGGWAARTPNGMKARTSGGLRLEWVGSSKENPANFIEMESLKAYRFDDLKFRFLSNSTVQVDDSDFTWFHLASQEWTGGTSTGSEASSLQVDGKTIGLNTNGDFWLVYGDEDVKARGLSAHQVNIFDKIPVPGDVISQNLQDLSKNGLIGKLSDTEFEVWGWAIQEGDQLTYSGKTYSVVKTLRKWKTWEQFAAQFSDPPQRLLRSDRRVTYTEIELDQKIPEPLHRVQFYMLKGAFQHLLAGNYISGCSAIWNFGNDAPGHLMYIDYNVNLILKNVQTHGMIRSTSRPLWVETISSLSGLVSSIPVSKLGAAIWKKGDKLQLAHPETKKVCEIELIEDFAGESGNLQIKPIQLSFQLPENSVVTALYSLCREAIFDNVNFVEEDLAPCYSERIDYRPQGLRLRQLITGNEHHRVKINGGRISWYSNLDNRFEPEIEITNHPHLVDPKSVVPVLLNPVVTDKKGVRFGYQYKQSGEKEIFVLSRVVVRGANEVDLSNSMLCSDLYIEGNGKITLDGLRTNHFIDNGRDMGIGFNLVIQDRFSISKSLVLLGENGKAGLMITTPYHSGALQIDFKGWKLIPALFNSDGFHSVLDENDANYSDYIKISDS